MYPVMNKAPAEIDALQLKLEQSDITPQPPAEQFHVKSTSIEGIHGRNRTIDESSQGASNMASKPSLLFVQFFHNLLFLRSRYLLIATKDID